MMSWEYLGRWKFRLSGLQRGFLRWPPREYRSEENLLLLLEPRAVSAGLPGFEIGASQHEYQSREILHLSAKILGS